MSEELINARLEGIEGSMREMRVMLTEVRDRQLSTHLCPRPGLCVPLEVRVSDHSHRLRSLEDTREQAKGAGWAVRVIWGVLGVSAAGVAAWVWKHL